MNSTLAVFMDFKYKTVYTPDNQDDGLAFKIAEKMRIEEQSKLNKALIDKDQFTIEREMIDNIVQVDLKDWSINFFNKTPQYLVHFSAKMFTELSTNSVHKINWNNFDKFIGDLYFYYSYLNNPFHNFKHANNGKHQLYPIFTVHSWSLLLLVDS
jgi:hypothetical protein